MSRFRVALMLLSCTTACGGEPLRSPADGDVAWHELVTTNLVVRTNLPLDDAEETTREFQGRFRAFEKVAFPYTPHLDQPVHVMVLRREQELTALGYEEADGAHIWGGWADTENMLLLHADGGSLSEEVIEVFQHELAHRFVDFYFPSAPVWFDEGLAEYFSALEIDEDVIVLGMPLISRRLTKGPWGVAGSRDRHFLVVPIDAVARPSRLVGMDRAAFYASGVGDERDRRRQRSSNYLAAWALVHVLQHGEATTDRLVSYMGALHRGRIGADRAFEEYLGSPYELDAEVEAFLQAEERTIVRLPYRPRETDPPRARRLAPAEVHLLWARSRALGRAFKDNRAQVSAIASDIARAARLAPASPKVLLYRARWKRSRGDVESAARDLERARAIDPKNMEVVRTLLDVHLDSRRSSRRIRDELARTLLRHAATAEQWELVARYLTLYRKRPRNALRYLRRALEIDRTCDRCYDTLADVYLDLGDLDNAVVAQRIALHLLPEDAAGSEIVRTREARLRELERKLTERGLQ